MNTVNKPFRKKDAMQLVTGQPVYMDDVIPQDCLIVKLLRSPHANAMVRTINTTVAKKVPGIEAIFTWEDVPQDAPRYTQAGQTFPEASPRDRLVIDRHVRFVGDVVAIVAGKDEKCVDKALKLILRLRGGMGISWCETSDMKYLWGNTETDNYYYPSSTIKTIYDPCPVGYKVPPADVLLVLCKGNEKTYICWATDSEIEKGFYIKSRDKYGTTFYCDNAGR